ncbi:MAG TPA: hypothetical protein DEP72_07730 [Clostridiales bacterium]|nr:MAG: hypothetical protein A2Y18_06750 [Clostridiales bacterium GWD2_32_19]HCC08026.1 hypothetical protein [Clostridiales bacterium]
MYVTKSKAKHRIAEGVELWNYLTAESGTSISVAYAELNGIHPESLSEMSDRCFMFVSGEATMHVGDEEYHVSAGDVVYVQRGEKYSLSGSASYFVINNPPYQKKS